MALVLAAHRRLRHEIDIQDRDVAALVASDRARINLEMAVTPAMLKLACKLKPAFVCLVPEKREELTTEGGLDVAAQLDSVRAGCQRLAKAGIAVSLFLDEIGRAHV